MVNITLAVSNGLHESMLRHAEIKWSEIARRAIESKVNELDIEENILKKSKLTKKDVDEISHKIKREVYNEMRKKWRLS